MTKAKKFPSDQLHPKAKKALNQSAEKLLEQFEQAPLQLKTETGFSSRKPVAGEINADDMLSEPMLAWTDWAGNTTGRYFVSDRVEHALKGEAYRKLRRFVDEVQKTDPFKTGFSSEFVEVEVFKWCQDRLQDNTSNNLVERLIKRAEDCFEEHKMVVPISSIEIEQPFILGDVLVTYVDKLFFQKSLAHMVDKNPDEKNQMEEHFNQLEKKFVGCTAIELSVWGEPEFAREKAEETAFDIAAVLRFLSPAAVSPEVPFPCWPHGCEHIPRITAFTRLPSELIVIQQRILKYGLFNWKFPFQDLDRQMKSGLGNLALFFENKPLTSHQQRVFGALKSYSKGVSAYEMSDRLIYAMSAVEHLFLRNENEPIQQGVGDRMAFLIKKESNDRKRVVKNFKRAYTLRSKHIHHLSGVENETALQDFYLNLNITLRIVIANMQKFNKHAEFLDTIDKIKYG